MEKDRERVREGGSEGGRPGGSERGREGGREREREIECIEGASSKCLNAPHPHQLCTDADDVLRLCLGERGEPDILT